MTINDDLTLKEYELKIIKATLQKYNNDIKKTAAKLDIGVQPFTGCCRTKKTAEIDSQNEKIFSF